MSQPHYTGHSYYLMMQSNINCALERVCYTSDILYLGCLEEKSQLDGGLL